MRQRQYSSITIQAQLVLRIVVVGAIMAWFEGSSALALVSRGAFMHPTKRWHSAKAQCGISTSSTTTTTTAETLLKASQEETEAETAASIDHSVGLYRPFAEHAWSKLLNDVDWFVEDPATVPPELSSNSAPAKGMPEGPVVKMTTRALVPSSPDHAKLVRYARYALLETLVPTTSGSRHNNSTVGIQVLNLVVFPAATTNLPVFGADVVSLPGNRHLLLLDAQPMDNTATKPRQYQRKWKDWHQQHVIGDNEDDHSFPWGGEIPDKVAKYVSDYALWARLVGSDGNTTTTTTTTTPVDPVTKIQTDFWEAFQDHLDLYLDLLSHYDASSSDSNNEQEPYVDYRLNNDPAKPMLKSLYGEEWTERVLQEVLFPNVTTTKV